MKEKGARGADARMLDEIVSRLSSKKMAAIMKIQSKVLKSTVDYMDSHGIVQVLPLVLAPFTDPLNHSTAEAHVECYGQKFQLMKSMILHKQLCLLSEDIKGIFVISPNVRLEKLEHADPRRHLFEFSQLDMELRGTHKDGFIDFMEGLYVSIIEAVIRDCSAELALLGRKLRLPRRPFKRYESKELLAKYGSDFEATISEKSKDPIWIMDHKREFYDREDKALRGYHHNYDLVYPEGFGEALSGGEREHEYVEIVRKMEERMMELGEYFTYLEIAKKGVLPRSAGAGFGIERMMRYLTGERCISEVSIFPRILGKVTPL